MSTDRTGFLRDAKIWDFTARSSEHPIERGGWRNSYNGQFFSKVEMTEYADNVFFKLEPYLDENKTVVLEIGCASGITMYRLAPFVKKYYGTDMASVNLQKNEKYNIKEGIDNIELRQCRADEIDELGIKDVDIVIMNSVLQYFPDTEYLMKVIYKATNIMSNDAIIFLGDIRDLDKKNDLEEEVRDYREKNGIKQLDFNKGKELFLPRSFVEEIPQHISGIRDAMVTDKIGSVDNELVRFRYDALLRVKKDEE